MSETAAAVTPRCPRCGSDRYKPQTEDFPEMTHDELFYECSGCNRDCFDENDVAFLRSENERLRAALKWVSTHNYAGGKTFADVEPVKSALTEAP